MLLLAPDVLGVLGLGLLVLGALGLGGLGLGGLVLGVILHGGGVRVRVLLSALFQVFPVLFLRCLFHVAIAVGLPPGHAEDLLILRLQTLLQGQGLQIRGGDEKLGAIVCQGNIREDGVMDRLYYERDEVLSVIHVPDVLTAYDLRESIHFFILAGREV